MSDQNCSITLEITGEAMWSPAEVTRALDFAARADMIGVTFHEADILTKCVFPSNYDPETSLWDGRKRRGVWAIHNNRAYLQNVARRCAARGLEFFLQTKELGYADEFTEDVPDITIDGVVCPTHPAWLDLLRRRYSQTCELLPELTGFIVSIGTLEGRSSLTTRRCGCGRCAATKDVQWHREIVGAIHEVTERFGRRLVVREFTYNPQDQQALLDGLQDMPDSVEYMVKPYARDYYLPWPDNPALGRLPGRRTWLEYDCHGQYFGWGILPVPVVQDQVARFGSATASGCSIVQLRVDWERINGLWAFDTFGLVNLYTAIGALRDPEALPRELVGTALGSAGIVSAEAHPSLLREIADHWLALYPLTLRVLYVLGNVYNTSSMIPNGVAQGWDYMSMLNAMRGWDGGSIGSLAVEDPEVVAAIVAEKDDVIERFDQWCEPIERWRGDGLVELPDPCGLGDVLAWLRLYVRAFVHSALIVVLVVAGQRRGLTSHEVDRLRDSVEDVTRLHAQASDRDASQTHHVDLLMNPEYLERMALSGRSLLDSTERSEAT